MSSSSPTTLLLDMDGVLAEVSQSYRSCILLTCKHFLKNDSVTNEVVSARKARGGCNNDWVLSLDLIKEYTTESPPSLEEVTAKFEDLYQGTSTTSGLCELETLIPEKGLLVELRRRCPGRMAIVTGRPVKDCNKFLELHGLKDLFDAAVCMEDGPAKPSPFPVLRACELLNVDPSTAVLVGDTPDDIRAAVSAGAGGIAVALPHDYARCVLERKELMSIDIVRAMKECGAVKVCKPGFVELLDVFK